MIQHPLEIPRAIHEAFYLARSGRPGPDRRRHPDRPLARRHPVRAGDRRAPARLPAHHRGQHQADPPGGQGAGGVAPARCSTPAAASSTPTRRPSSSSSPTSDSFPITCTLMGLGAFPAPHEQWLGMLGHARHAHGQLRDGRGRPHLRDRRALRRPHHRQARRSSRRARSSSTSTSTRPRSPRTSRPTSRSSATRKNILAKLVGRVPRAGGRQRAPGRVVAAHPRLAGAPSAALRGLRRQPRSSRSTWSRRSTRRPAATRSSPPTSASTRCGRRSTSTSSARASWINSGGLGTMGFGLPAAMGAKVGCPDEVVVVHLRRRLVPDEHPGARDLRRGGDRRQGLHHEQRLPGHGPPVAGAVLGPALLARRRGRWPDFVKLAEAYGCTGMRCTDKTTLVAQMREALETPGPVVVDVARHRRGERLPDDRARRRRARHGGLSHGRARDQAGDPQPRGARGRRRHAHRAQARPHRSSSRTSRAS